MTAPEYPIRTLAEEDFLPIHHTLTDWWDDWGDPHAARQRQLLLPRLFFQHFADTSAVVRIVPRGVVDFGSACSDLRVVVNAS